MKLHISNLSPKATERQLDELFSKFGKVLNLEINWVHSVGRTTGTAVIEMHPAEALLALRALNGRAFRSRRLYIIPLEEPNRVPPPRPPTPAPKANKAKGGT